MHLGGKVLDLVQSHVSISILGTFLSCPPGESTVIERLAVCPLSLCFLPENSLSPLLFSLTYFLHQFFSSLTLHNSIKRERETFE